MVKNVLILNLLVFFMYSNLAFAEKRFEDLKTGAIKDKVSGLIWLQNEDGKQRSFANAKKYCDTLIGGGYNDWSLPTLKQLYSLVDKKKYNPTIDLKYFPKTKNSWYWSSSLLETDDSYARAVNFKTGNNGSYYLSSKRYVKCVR